jgi:hypothetical protein
MASGVHLPAGWTIEDIREVSGDTEAVVLHTDRLVRCADSRGPGEVLRAEFILGFHELCLVKPFDDDDWYIGSLKVDGDIDCWSSYGNDLAEALRGL